MLALAMSRSTSSASAGTSAGTSRPCTSSGSSPHPSPPPATPLQDTLLDLTTMTTNDTYKTAAHFMCGNNSLTILDTYVTKTIANVTFGGQVRGQGAGHSARRDFPLHRCCMAAGGRPGLLGLAAGAGAGAGSRSSCCAAHLCLWLGRESRRHRPSAQQADANADAMEQREQQHCRQPVRPPRLPPTCALPPAARRLSAWVATPPSWPATPSPSVAATCTWWTPCCCPAATALASCRR